MGRKLRLTPHASKDNTLRWAIEEYTGWISGWEQLGSSISLEGAKMIIKEMKESEK